MSIKSYRTICVTPETMCPLSNEPIELGSTCVLLEGHRNMIVSPKAMAIQEYLKNNNLTSVNQLEFKAPEVPLKVSGLYRSTAKYTNKPGLDDTDVVVVLRVTSVDRTYDTYTVLDAKSSIARNLLELRECKLEELPDLKDYM